MKQYNITNQLCYTKVVDSDNLWGDVTLLRIALPKLVLQMTFAIIVNYGISFVFHRLRQLRILSDILTAMVLSPSTLNKIHHGFGSFLFPKASLTILETVGNLGLLYIMFIQGLHADLTPISHKRVRTTCLGLFTFILPFLIGCALYFAFRTLVPTEKNIHNVEVVTLYWGLIIAATSFPTLAPILAKLRIFCTNLGQDALSLGLLNDVMTWVIVHFILAISTSSPNNYHHLSSPCTWWVITFMIVYMGFCGLVIKPVILKLSSKIPEGENCTFDLVLQSIMCLVLLCGFLGNYFGSYFIFTAFVLGTSVPCGILSESFIQKIEEFVLIILMPLYFAVMGTKVNIIDLIGCLKYPTIIVIGVLAKALCTIPSSLFCKIPVNDGFALGILLSSKGLLPLIILNIGHDREHLSQESYSLLLVILMLSTSLVGPITSVSYARIRNRNRPYDRRTLEGAKQQNDELRIFTCIHTPQNVYNIINLLEISNITSKPNIGIFAIHLVELLGHASPILVEHEKRKSSWDEDSQPFFRRIRNKSFEIIEAFHEYEDKKGVLGLAQIVTMVSPLDIIHDDICSLADDKQASLIILSFHGRQGIDSKLDDANIEFKDVNQNVIANAPCSVALFIDRGLQAPSLTSSSIHKKNDNISHRHAQTTMVYIGGPDDREALIYASKMASHPFVTLTILRILFVANTMENNQIDGYSDNFAIWKQVQREKEIDDNFIDTFMENNAHDESIRYIEKLAKTGNEAISILREKHDDCNLYIIGKGQSGNNPLVENLEVWSEYKELGPLGDILVTSDFSTNSSVLVIQQYRKEPIEDENDIEIDKETEFYSF